MRLRVSAFAGRTRKIASVANVVNGAKGRSAASTPLGGMKAGVSRGGAEKERSATFARRPSCGNIGQRQKRICMPR